MSSEKFLLTDYPLLPSGHEHTRVKVALSDHDERIQWCTTTAVVCYSSVSIAIQVAYLMDKRLPRAAFIPLGGLFYVGAACSFINLKMLMNRSESVCGRWFPFIGPRWQFTRPTLVKFADGTMDVHRGWFTAWKQERRL